MSPFKRPALPRPACSSCSSFAGLERARSAPTSRRFLSSLSAHSWRTASGHSPIGTQVVNPIQPDDEGITAEGLEALKAELADLETEGRRAMGERINAARELGDLKENAEYHIA